MLWEKVAIQEKKRKNLRAQDQKNLNLENNTKSSLLGFFFSLIHYR